MHTARFALVPAALVAALALVGCSQPNGSGAASHAGAAPASSSAAQEDLHTYRELIKINNDAMATQMGQSIEQKYPGTPAAKEVAQTLPGITRRYEENSEKQRLAGLWLYQVSPMAGGTQSTATIYSSEPAGEDKVRLVLRRHTAWGLNVFLYGSGNGFVCRHTCTLPATFGGRKEGLKAFAPLSGEPALMIKDDKGFIARMEKAKKITIDVTTVNGNKAETLVFEVGGFVPSKWQALPNKKDSKKSRKK